MKLLEFAFKNIFSYGNKLQRIELKQDEPQLVLVCGAKGQGKSSIKEAITLSAYGKSPSRSLKNIPNRINKNAYLYTKFVSNTGDLVEIERGLSPNMITLKINGDTPPSLPDKKKIDDYIENSLIQMPFNVFCNTITVSVNDFKSFVSLSPMDKRKIVDKIFGIGEVNDMSTLNKTDLSKLQQTASSLDFSIQRNQDILESSIGQLEQLKKDVKVNNDAKIAELKARVEEVKVKMEDSATNYNDLTKPIFDLRAEIQALTDKGSKWISGLQEIDKKIELYNKNKCPHCLSDLTDAAHLTIKEKLLTKKEEVSAKLPELKKELAEKRAADLKLSNEQLAVKGENSNAKYELSQLEFQIRNLEAEAKSDTGLETSRLSELINSIEQKIEDARLELANINEEIIVHQELARILSDDGMKKILMARIIPMINQRIIERAAEIEFPYSFSFNENFDPIINHLGQSIELESLSVGEQKEMNLITLFCILDLVLMKNNLNFLFLDEVFTSLDSESIYRVVSMLRSFTDKHKITVFAISHDPLPQEFFDVKLTIKKDKHFSDIHIG